MLEGVALEGEITSHGTKCSASDLCFESRNPHGDGVPSLPGISVHPDLAVLRLDGGKTLSARLVLDCMGHASPVVRQLR